MKMHKVFSWRYSYLTKLFFFSTLNMTSGVGSKKGACLALSRPFLGNSPPFLLLPRWRLNAFCTATTSPSFSQPSIETFAKQAPTLMSIRNKMHWKVFLLHHYWEMRTQPWCIFATARPARRKEVRSRLLMNTKQYSTALPILWERSS